jgi:hypothetical protein
VARRPLNRRGIARIRGTVNAWTHEGRTRIRGAGSVAQRPSRLN